MSTGASHPKKFNRDLLTAKHKITPTSSQCNSIIYIDGQRKHEQTACTYITLCVRKTQGSSHDSLCPRKSPNAAWCRFSTRCRATNTLSRPEKKGMVTSHPYLLHLGRVCLRCFGHVWIEGFQRADTCIRKVEREHAEGVHNRLERGIYKTFILHAVRGKVVYFIFFARILVPPPV